MPVALSHTLTQDRRYRARFSYKYPMGGTPDATSCLALSSFVSHLVLSLSLIPSGVLLLLSSLTFLLCFSLHSHFIYDVQAACSSSFHLLYLSFSIAHIFQGMSSLQETNCLHVICMRTRVSPSCLDCSV